MSSLARCARGRRSARASPSSSPRTRARTASCWPRWSRVRGPAGRGVEWLLPAMQAPAAPRKRKPARSPPPCIARLRRRCHRRTNVGPQPRCVPVCGSRTPSSPVQGRLPAVPLPPCSAHSARSPRDHASSRTPRAAHYDVRTTGKGRTRELTTKMEKLVTMHTALHSGVHLSREELRQGGLLRVLELAARRAAVATASRPLALQLAAHPTLHTLVAAMVCLASAIGSTPCLTPAFDKHCSTYWMHPSSAAKQEYARLATMVGEQEAVVKVGAWGCVAGGWILPRPTVFYHHALIILWALRCWAPSCFNQRRCVMAFASHSTLCRNRQPSLRRWWRRRSLCQPSSKQVWWRGYCMQVVGPVRGARMSFS